MPIQAPTLTNLLAPMGRLSLESLSNILSRYVSFLRYGYRSGSFENRSAEFIFRWDSNRVYPCAFRGSSRTWHEAMRVVGTCWIGNRARLDKTPVCVAFFRESGWISDTTPSWKFPWSRVSNRHAYNGEWIYLLFRKFSFSRPRGAT